MPIYSESTNTTSNTPAERLRQITSTEKARSKSVDDQFAQIQKELDEIEELVESSISSSSASIEGKSTTIERDESEQREWDDENIDDWCKKVDEIISSYTTRPARTARKRARRDRKASRDKKMSTKRFRRKKLKAKRKSQSKSSSSSLEKTDKRLASIEKMLKSLSKSPSSSRKRRSKKRFQRSSRRKSLSKKKSLGKSSSKSSESSTSLDARMKNIQTLLDYARETSSPSASESPDTSELAEILRTMKHVFGNLAGREIMDKELISELIQMQTRFQNS